MPRRCPFALAKPLRDNVMADWGCGSVDLPENGVAERTPCGYDRYATPIA